MHGRLVLAPLALLVATAIPASACSGGSGEDAAQYCHDYTLHADAAGHKAHANERGQFLLELDALGGIYVEQDADYADPANPWLLSVWIYFESNGHDGLQRDDEVCDTTPDGWESDSIIC